MNQVRFRQIARLEKRALPYIKQREGIAQQLRNLHRGAVAHATVLALLVRYGNRSSASHCPVPADALPNLSSGDCFVRNSRQIVRSSRMTLNIHFLSLEIKSPS